MDITQILNGINSELATLEEKKKQKFLSDQRKNYDDIWFVTRKEFKALKEFSEKIKGYRSIHKIQERVIQFATRVSESRNYYVLAKFEYPYSKEVNIYVDKSKYWNKKSVTINTGEEADSSRKPEKIVYAVNDEMNCVIFAIDETIYLSTFSSFENYLLVREGKPVDKSQGKRKPFGGNSKDQRVNTKEEEEVMNQIKEFNEASTRQTPRHQMEQLVDYQRNL